MQRRAFIPVLDPADPRIEPYRSLKGKRLEQDGVFMAEGDKVVRELVASRHSVVSCLTARETADRFRTILNAMRKKGVPVYVAPLAVIEGIIGFRFHRGIMALGRCPEKLEAAARIGTARQARLLVALNAVNDPQNVGLIVRTAAAFGAGALIVDDETYDPYYRKAVRVSMGTVFSLPVCYESDLVLSLAALKERFGTRIVVTTPGGGAVDIRTAELSGSVCFVLGNEDAGVSRRVARIADAKVRIPIVRQVDSLNVAAAAAICLHEASRRPRVSL